MIFQKMSRFMAVGQTGNPKNYWIAPKKGAKYFPYLHFDWRRKS
jgi:hypothetical protein